MSFRPGRIARPAIEQTRLVDLLIRKSVITEEEARAEGILHDLEPVAWLHANPRVLSLLEAIADRLPGKGWWTPWKVVEDLAFGHKTYPRPPLPAKELASRMPMPAPSKGRISVRTKEILDELRPEAEVAFGRRVTASDLAEYLAEQWIRDQRSRSL